MRNLTGVPIDYFAEVNLAGFYDLTDGLGGVEVCLNHAVHDEYSGADFPAGARPSTPHRRWRSSGNATGWRTATSTEHTASRRSSCP